MQNYFISVLLNRVSTNFKVYSGAGFTLIPEDEYDKLHIYVAIILTNVFFTTNIVQCLTFSHNITSFALYFSY